MPAFKAKSYENAAVLVSCLDNKCVNPEILWKHYAF